MEFLDLISVNYIDLKFGTSFLYFLNFAKPHLIFGIFYTISNRIDYTKFANHVRNKT